MTRVAAVPVLSPSGNRAVALQSNLMSGVDLNVIDMTGRSAEGAGGVQDAGLRRLGPDSFLRPKPVWIDESHVRFEGTSPQPGDDPGTRQLLKIGAGTAEWEC